MLNAEYFYVGAGVLIWAVALSDLLAGRQTSADVAPRSGTDWRRAGRAAFYGLLGTAMALGRYLAPEVVGGLVLAMVALASAGCVRATPRSAEAEQAAVQRQQDQARVLGNRLFWPALAIPAVVVFGGWALGEIGGEGWRLVDPKQVNQVALGLGCGVGLWAAMNVTRARPVEVVSESGRLLHALGWALLLPQLLAGLGGMFARAGVGEWIARGVEWALPMQFPWVAVVAYCTAMLVFTVVMGNAFAAFSVVTLGIGLPFIVRQHGGNPAIMGALGLLSGYCGTLLTPMAANFNLVPALLLNLGGSRDVIRAQAPFAVALWIFNGVVMALCVYRF